MKGLTKLKQSSSYNLIKIYNITCKQRMNRHNWTSEEDSQLKQVVQINGSEDWTKNAELLRQISSTAEDKKRTGKQCRQRWYNHLDPTVVKSQWRAEEQGRLFEMHKIHGNKWKELTRYLPGRTDNDIKNHFYSTLRRSLRRLNKYTGEKNSTNQMRQIKPSVLTFIINHIYSQEIKQNQNKHLIDSLKQLPQLIFKFSTFKPVKQNMDKKIDDTLRDKISLIMTLVDQFKQLYREEKNWDVDKSQLDRKLNKKTQNRQEAVTSKGGRHNQNNHKRADQSDDQSEMRGEEEESQNQNHVNKLKQQFNSQQNYVENAWNTSESNKKFMKQFAPIVTIQRKPSGYEQKANSKKLILMAKTQEKIQENFHYNNCHIRALSFHQDDEVNQELMPIEQPSMSINENSQFLSDLVVIGKHIEPIECQATNEQQNFCEIDEILYENYQN